MSFVVLPPEINSLRIFIGAGTAPMLAGRAAARRPAVRRPHRRRAQRVDVDHRGNLGFRTGYQGGVARQTPFEQGQCHRP